MIQLIILLGIISIIDFSTKKIPVVVLIVMGIVGIASSFYAQQSTISVAVALIPGIVLMAAAFLTREQIGYGDAAVVTLMGLFVTADIVCSTMVMGFTIAGIISVILIASGRAGRKMQIAFTPFLLLGYGLTEVFM
ncbi:prepilin peptidase [Agathobacter rectalis]|uniref:prepilin peptidase n=1 Tax=Agathobacter rectalis TaxID=39491 RepID=UPI0027D2C278|nr:prepilin peptidase [Agathobacter rectalis]